VDFGLTAAVVPGTDILQLFYAGPVDGMTREDRGSLVSRWRNPDGSWSDEQNLVSEVFSWICAAAVPGTDILQLFYRGADQSVRSMWRNPDGSWSGEQNLGGQVSSDTITAAVIPGTDILQLFYEGPGESLRSMWRNPDGSWSGEQNLGGQIFAGSGTAAAVPI
jgi:hypothetical protein